MKAVHFVDTTLRDGQMSLWATGMTTAMMLPVASAIDHAGFEAVEIMASAFFKKLVRELRDDPWERLRMMAQQIKKTPLRAIRSRHMAAFHITPRSISDLWVERLAANGVRELRLSDPSNTPAHWAQAVRSARAVGLSPIVNLIFSISPKHTDDYYAEKTRAAAKLDVERLCVKDPGGLLTPERTRTLVPAVLRQSNGIPVEFHTHCNMGLGPLCCLEAIKLGITSINTAIPPLANGSSNPSVVNVAANARALGYRPVFDEAAIKPVTSHFTAIAERTGLPTGRPLEYDAHHPLHQVPGGMISNFRHQLARMGMAARLGEVLTETARVRAELGFPIMVTPYSQFVGSQAAINVIVGERYKEVTDELIQYAVGLWGEEEQSSIEPNVKDKILSRRRAKEISQWQPPEPSLKELREKLGGPGASDDDLLLRYFAGADEVAALRAAASPSWHVAEKHPLVAMVEKLTRSRERRQIHIKKGPLSLRLEQRKKVTSDQT
jgi:oxaloacetate decarboxylase (Na+ extruding) subunit alpha